MANGDAFQENNIGVLCSRWLCLARTMYSNPKKAQLVISACCLLHNLLMSNSKDSYAPVGFMDSFDENGVIVPGSFMKLINENSLFNSNLSGSRCRNNETATIIRNEFKDFFNSSTKKLINKKD